jgi:hypothetical protein
VNSKSTPGEGMMKIETRDMVVTPEPDPEPASELDPGLVRQAALALMLACVLVVTLCWALNVTNANARQVSRNLSTMQDRIDGPWPGAPAGRHSGSKSLIVRGAKGPTIEPAEDP